MEETQLNVRTLLARYDAAVAAETKAHFTFDENEARATRNRLSLQASEAPARAAEAAAVLERTRATEASTLATAACDSANKAEAVNAALIEECRRLTNDEAVSVAFARSVDAEVEAGKIAQTEVEAEITALISAAKSAALASKAALDASAKREAEANERLSIALAAADACDIDEAAACAEKNRLEGYLVTSYVRDRSKMVRT